MIRKEKENSVKLAKEILSSNEMLVLMDYKGLNAENFTKLRAELKDKKAGVRVFKNTLFKKAIKDTDFGFLENLLFEQVAVSYSNDPISLSNVINTFNKELSKGGVVVKGVALNNKLEDIAIIGRMAGLGSFDDIRARFIGVLQGAGSQLVGVLEAYAKKQEN
ncbi:MAG: 50S ribosomal protein L10 [Rickettsiales bacterium]|jgi:large subunit ribosomal protein L10|nr:50S ribosomal protein L10 [Rickettsiales bacterium]